MRFVVVDGLPYLYADGKTFACRFDEKGLTIGTEVELASVPDHRLIEQEVFAKCECLDSMKEKPKTTGRKKAAEK